MVAVDDPHRPVGDEDVAATTERRAARHEDAVDRVCCRVDPGEIPDLSAAGVDRDPGGPIDHCRGVRVPAQLRRSSRRDSSSGSMRAMVVVASQPVTQTASGPDGHPATRGHGRGIMIVAWTLFVTGLIRATVLLFGMSTQMLPRPLASQLGPLLPFGPTVTVRDDLVHGRVHAEHRAAVEIGDPHGIGRREDALRRHACRDARDQRPASPDRPEAGPPTSESVAQTPAAAGRETLVLVGLRSER